MKHKSTFIFDHEVIFCLSRRETSLQEADGSTAQYMLPILRKNCAFGTLIMSTELTMIIEFVLLIYVRPIHHVRGQRDYHKLYYVNHIHLTTESNAFYPFSRA